MAMTLYHGAPNGPSLTVLAALFETGTDATLVPIDLASGERHGDLVPRSVEVEMSIEGEGPVLVADGEPMADSLFIALYLAERAGGDALRPADPYARWEMMSWCRYMIERVAPAAAFLAAREHLTPRLQAMSDDAFEAMIRRIASADLAARWRETRAGVFADDKRADSRVKIVQAVARLEASLDGDWIFDIFSIADLETYAWLAGMVELVPEAFADAPRTAAWLDRVKARPSVAHALALSGSDDPRHGWAVGPEINRWG